MRGKQAPKRKIKPDPRYNNLEIAKLINYIMERGKKTVAQKIVYDAFDIISAKTKKDPLVVFETAIRNVSPVLEVKGRRVGGANYQIPTPVRGNRRTTLAFRWIITAAQAKKGKPMKEKLALELMDAANKEGTAIKKREDVHKMAKANQAFAHYRW